MFESMLVIIWKIIVSASMLSISSMGIWIVLVKIYDMFKLRKYKEVFEYAAFLPIFVFFIVFLIFYLKG